VGESVVITIDPKKVVQFGPPAVQQLAKLANECMKYWKDAPLTVKMALGDSVALLNKVVQQENDDGGSDKAI
jgi:hypothetical protein